LERINTIVRERQRRREREAEREAIFHHNKGERPIEKTLTSTNIIHVRVLKCL
jgi:hypothetical protein